MDTAVQRKGRCCCCCCCAALPTTYRIPTAVGLHTYTYRVRSLYGMCCYCCCCWSSFLLVVWFWSERVVFVISVLEKTGKRLLLLLPLLSNCCTAAYYRSILLCVKVFMRIWIPGGHLAFFCYNALYTFVSHILANMHILHITRFYYYMVWYLV